MPDLWFFPGKNAKKQLSFTQEELIALRDAVSEEWARMSRHLATLPPEAAQGAQEYTQTLRSLLTRLKNAIT